MRFIFINSNLIINRRLLLVLALSIIVVIFISIGTLGCNNAFFPETDEETELAINNDYRKLQLQGFDLNKFYRSLQVPAVEEYSQQLIYGGIVNHHLLADGLIAEFYATVAASQPELILLVGPNHSSAGVETIHTSIWDWETPFGNLEVNQELTNYLVNEEQVGYSFELAANEHSISVHVPYIKHFMPNSKLVPLIFSSALEPNVVIDLAGRIYEQIKGKRVMIIASIDFSHYLSLEEADKRDLITKELVINRDSQRLSQLNNEYLDSPVSAIFMFSLLEKLDSSQQVILNHGNSARIHPSEFKNTTSYLTAIYF